MKEPEFTSLTYDLTLNFAKTLCSLNPEMTFCYISGSGTDSTEKGKMMWARVKGRTENDLMKLPFRAVYAFRPAFMKPGKGLKNTLPAYKYLSWLYPLLKPVFPGYFGTLKDVGLAMVNSVLFGYNEKVLEVMDIALLAEKTAV